MVWEQQNDCEVLETAHFHASVGMYCNTVFAALADRPWSPDVLAFEAKNYQIGGILACFLPEWYYNWQVKRAYLKAKAWAEQELTSLEEEYSG